MAYDARAFVQALMAKELSGFSNLHGKPNTGFAFSIEKNGQKYFLKVSPDGVKIDMEKVKEILRLYDFIGIKTAKIIEYGTKDFAGAERNYIVYEYIHGGDLYSHLATVSNLTDIAYNYGRKLGANLYDLQGLTPLVKPEMFQPPKMISAITADVEQYLDYLEQKSVFAEYFSAQDCRVMRCLLRDGSALIQTLPTVLIHGDLSCNNIMVDPRGDLVLVDVESAQVNNQLMNFFHQMRGILCSRRETSFASGYFDAIYGRTRPDVFAVALRYVFLVDFISNIYFWVSRGYPENFVRFVDVDKNNWRSLLNGTCKLLYSAS